MPRRKMPGEGYTQSQSVENHSSLCFGRLDTRPVKNRRLTVKTLRQGVIRLTATAAFVSASLCCSRNRTDVRIKARTQIDSDE